MNLVHDDPSSIAALLRARYRRRLPASLNELVGPEHGMVGLPLHIAWSGLRTLDLDLPRQRMSLYRTSSPKACVTTSAASSPGHPA